MKSVNHLKVFGISVLIFLLFLTIGFTMQDGRVSTLPERAARDGMVFVQNGYLGLAESGRRLVRNVRDLFHTFEENRILREQLFNYQSLYARHQLLEAENASLRELLDTGYTLLEVNTQNAVVILRNPGVLHNFILVNKGNADGVVPDMAVLSREGYLVGHVSEVYEHSARVLLMNPQNQSGNASASVEGVEGADGLFRGFDSSTGELVMTLVPRDLEIEPGSRVVTNGLGGVVPPGLLVGYVERSQMASDALTQTLYLRSGADFNQLDFVILVERLAVVGE